MAEERKGNPIEKWDEVNGVAEVTRLKDPNELGNQMRGIEDMVEQNDNSFDGIINNLPEPEEQEKAKYDEARESVIEKLKEALKILEDDKECHQKVVSCELERS